MYLCDQGMEKIIQNFLNSEFLEIFSSCDKISYHILAHTSVNFLTSLSLKSWKLFCQNSTIFCGCQQSMVLLHFYISTREAWASTNFYVINLFIFNHKFDRNLWVRYIEHRELDFNSITETIATLLQHYYLFKEMDSMCQQRL